jgi:hypothetical protein
VTQSAEPLIPALCLMLFMPREELVGALQARLAQMEGQLSETAFIRSSIEDGATGADGGIPEHVREIMDFMTSRTRAELDWTRSLLKRLRDGRYRFSGDEGFPVMGPGVGYQAGIDNQG